MSRKALVPGAPRARTIYVRDLATGRTTLASELDGVPANESESSAISETEQWLNGSNATNLGGPKERRTSTT